MISRKPLTFATLALVALASAPAISAADTTERVEPVRHDVSPPLRQLIDEFVPKERSDAKRQIPLQFKHNPQQVPNIGAGADPLWQQDQRPIPGASLTPDPILNFDGLSDQDNADVAGTRIAPPDTEGDVGAGHYFQWINLVFAVYDKNTGQRLAGPAPGDTIFSGFGGECEDLNSGDPIVFYDHLADRWFLSQFAVQGLFNFQSWQCVAVSQTSDPLGPYNRYQYQFIDGLSDYPKASLWTDAYYFTYRDFLNNGVQQMSIVAMDRDAMIAGNPNAATIKVNLDPGLGIGAVQPAHLAGPAPPDGTPAIIATAWDGDFDPDGAGNSGMDGYRLWEFIPDFDTPANSSFQELPRATGADYDRNMCGFFNRSCIPQRNGEGLDATDELTMFRAQYRHFGTHDSIVLNTTVDVNGNDLAGVRWAELRNTGGGWDVHQEGTYAPDDGLERWEGSVAMDAAGNMALGFSASSSNDFPSIRYTSREAGDPLGTMPGGEVVMLQGTGSQTASSNRWGDYSTMDVDDADGCTFWYTQEYYETTGSFDFKTRIANFRLPSCDDSDAFAIVDVSPCEAGAVNTWTVAGAVPGATVEVQCRVVGGQNNVRVGTGVADGSGTATVDRMVVDRASGESIQCRAVDQDTNEASPAITKTFE